MKLILQELEG